MSWNYRVLNYESHGEQTLGVFEMYYDDAGAFKGCTTTPVYLGGYEDMEELRSSLTRMLEALDKPVLEDPFP